MNIVARKYNLANKAPEEIIKIIQASASNFKRRASSGTVFHMYFVTRRFDGKRVSVPIVAQIEEIKNKTELTLCVEAGFDFWIGAMISLLGFAGMIWSFLSNSKKVPAFGGGIIIGAIICMACVWQGVSCLDSIERNLEIDGHK